MHHSYLLLEALQQQALLLVFCLRGVDFVASKRRLPRLSLFNAWTSACCVAEVSNAVRNVH